MPRNTIEDIIISSTVIFLGLQVFLFSGCSGNMTSREDIVPSSQLPEEKQSELRALVNDNNYIKRAARYKFAEEYGEAAVPFMIEYIMKTYELGSDWKNPELYSIASNLILSLGEMRDERALPALRAWLIEKKYRVFRSSAAYALGEFGKRDIIDDLWSVWRQERSYLARGDDEGPWPFLGYHPSGYYVHRVLSEVAEALYKMGERQVIGELVEVAEISDGKWSSGYRNIIWTLKKLKGQNLAETNYDIDYWTSWWAENKSKYISKD